MVSTSASVTTGSVKSFLAYAMAGNDAFLFSVGIIVACTDGSLQTLTSTGETGSRIELTYVFWAEVALFAVFTIDAGSVVSTSQANSTPFELPLRVQTTPLRFDLRVEETFVGMSKTLTPFASIGRNEFAWAPKLLVVHGTALSA